MNILLLITTCYFPPSPDNASVAEHLIGMGEVISQFDPLPEDAETIQAELFVLGTLDGSFAGHSLIALGTQVSAETVEEDRWHQKRFQVAVENAVQRESLKEFNGWDPEAYAFRDKCLLLATRFEESQLRALQELAASTNGELRRAARSALTRLVPEDAATWLLAADAAASSAEKLRLIRRALKCKTFVERDLQWRNAGRTYWAGADSSIRMFEPKRKETAFNLFWESAERERSMNRWHQLNSRIVDFLFTELQNREGTEQKAESYDLIFRYGMACVELSKNNSQLAFQGATVVLRVQNAMSEDGELPESKRAALQKQFRILKKLVVEMLPTRWGAPDLKAKVDQSLVQLRKACAELTRPAVAIH